MLPHASRSVRTLVVFSVILIAGSRYAISQDPPRSLPDLQSDDPVMRALRERAVIAPIKPVQPLSRPLDRWRVAERLLRQARIMERDAHSLEKLGDTEAASTLRDLAATTRDQVLRILPKIDKTSDVKQESVP